VAGMNCVIAVGDAYFYDDGDGDWEGLTEKGCEDAVIVAHDPSLMLFVPVTNITNVPTKIISGNSLILKGTVEPPNATNQVIHWSVVDAGTTGAFMDFFNDNILNVPSTGTVKIKATIINGKDIGEDYTQYFIIESRLGVSDIGFAKNSIIYPNPTTGILNIEVTESIAIKSISIYNVEGKLIKKNKYFINSQQLDISNFKKGNYIINIETDKGNFNQIIVKN
jgi:hypothetical protein